MSLLPWRKRSKDLGWQPDDDRSFAVALRLEMVAKRLAIINGELLDRLEEGQPKPDERVDDQ